ncbi:MAG: BNR/Asp-box repeat protein [Pedosphaera sp.]|nr:BNR/Asp-box repeat protein [Pedosphaera sp.]
MKLNFCFRKIVLHSVFLMIAGVAFAAPPTQWAPKGVGGGGALFAPSFNPFNSAELYLACDMSEVFRSTNFGTSWTPVNFKQIQGGRQSIIQYTSNSSILYAIDYTSIGGADSMTPTRSLDGGTTWQRLAVDPTGGGAYALFVDPASTNRLLVSDYANVYYSSNGGSTFNPKFTAGGGCFVAGAFFDAGNIFVGTSSGLLVSTNGGGTFALSSVGGIPAVQAMFSFAGAKQGAVTRLFCITLNAADVYPGLFIEDSYGSYGGVYALDWGQPNWTARVTGIVAGHQPVFVAMAQNDVSTAYIAGQQSTIDYPVLYKTGNGGANWQAVLQITNNQDVFTGWAGNGGDRDWSYGAGALGLAVAPFDSSKVAYTDLGFAHLSTNGGVFWKQLYVEPADQNPMNAATPKGKSYRSIGLENTSCWGVTWADSNHIVAGYSDMKGIISADGGNSWSFGYTGHNLNSMYRCVKHPTTGVLYAGTASVHDMYQSTHLTDSSIGNGTGLVLFSSNLGVTWQTMTNFNHPVIWIAADPVNPTRLYASVIATNQSQAGIYVSTNIQNGAAASWLRLPPPPRTEGHPFNIHVLHDGTIVCTYSGRRTTTSFTASSGVFVSTNSGATWIDRSHTNMVYWTKDLVIDPNDATQSTWYVGVFSGWGGAPNGLGGLYKTTNRGVSWTRLNSLDRVTSCALNPLNANELYLTTETDGLWITTNLNSVTPSFAQVTSYPFRQPERIFFNPYKPSEMWVTSFGNGIRVGNTASLPGILSLNGTTLHQDGTARLTFQQATPGVPYSILGSTNLTNWFPLGTNTAGANGLLRFNDTNAGGFTKRFYRSQAL